MEQKYQSSQFIHKYLYLTLLKNPFFNTIYSQIGRVITIHLSASQLSPKTSSDPGEIIIVIPALDKQPRNKPDIEATIHKAFPPNNSKQTTDFCDKKT